MRFGKIPVLTYHSLDESGSVISTSPAVFQKQMEYLSKNGYRTLLLSDLIDLIYRRIPFPEKAFVITLDDGYENTYAHAYPVLERFGFKATVFLVSDHCGKYNDWAGRPSPLGRCPMLSWAQIREMHGAGFEIGSHTATHPDLTRISLGEVERETERSKADIQERLGTKVDLFAYPYGKWNQEIKGIVQKQFRGACATRLGSVDAEGDPYLLNRIEMFYFARREQLKGLSTHALEAYLFARQFFRDVKEIFERIGPDFKQGEDIGV